MDLLPTLSERQQSVLRLLLHEEQGLTLDQLAEKLGISRNAVNQHMVVLEKLGCIDSKTMPSEGGRPSRAFTLSETGKSYFPKQYALFSLMLLKTVSDKLVGDELQQLLTSIGNQLALPFKERVAKSDNKLEEISLIMEELGYETRNTDGDFPVAEIVAKNCVFHDLAMENNAVCELDRSLIEALLDTRVTQLECMAKGGDSCRFCTGTS